MKSVAAVLASFVVCASAPAADAAPSESPSARVSVSGVVRSTGSPHRNSRTKSVPGPLPRGGDVRVWTTRPAGGPPLAVVTARDAAALHAVARVLPHYGSQSWLVFDGGQVRARGVWEAPGPAVAVAH